MTITWRKYNLFTVSFFPEEFRPDLSILGSRSGRDADKVALTGLTPVETNGSVSFAQAELTFVCRKLYSHQFEKEKVPKDAANWIYSKGLPPHTMFIGEVIEAVERSRP
ncbi:MAG: flavin reductase [Oscillospiraceae bacterium]|nr:flavin reductase [Oscillospiraceae bacterium]